MMVIPAVDIRGGDCVQLVGGSFAQERVRLPDPLGVARNWVGMGFRRVHVVDLDAAVGAGTNASAVETLVRDVTADDRATVQVGGGVRDTARVDALICAGASGVIVGTRALEDRAWLVEIATRYPGVVLVAADVRGRCVVTRGWRETLPLDVLEFVRGVDALPLGGLLVTAVHAEGQMNGTDMDLMERVACATRHPVIASGGVASASEIRALAACGVAGVVIGMALYTGALDARALAEEFPS